MIKVYIASPYTVGDIAVNVKRQIDYADILIGAGFAPFVPLYYHFQHMVHPRSYEDWTRLDLEWVKVCDCVLRLPGESKGADNECNFASRLMLPVFYDITDLFDYYGTPVKG